jgi:hypothetical protein
MPHERRERGRAEHSARTRGVDAPDADSLELPTTERAVLEPGVQRGPDRAPLDVDLRVCLPDEVVRELDRVLGDKRAVTEAGLVTRECEASVPNLDELRYAARRALVDEVELGWLK